MKNESESLFLGCGYLFSIFPFCVCLGEAVKFCPPWLDLCGVSVACALGRCRPGALAPTVRHFGQGGALTSSAVFPSIPIYLSLLYFETFYSSCILFFSPYVGKVRAQGRGGAHPHATTVAAAVHTLKGWNASRLVQNLAWGFCPT